MARKVLLFACCLVLLSGGLFYASLLLAGPRVQPRHEAPAVAQISDPSGPVLACLASLDVALPPGAKFLRSQRSQGQPVAYWALIQVTSEQVAGIEQSFRAFADRSAGRWTLAENADLDSAAQLGPEPPEWWDPRHLPDAHGMLLKRHGGLFVVLSRQTGLLYVMVF